MLHHFMSPVVLMLVIVMTRVCRGHSLSLYIFKNIQTYLYCHPVNGVVAAECMDDIGC